MISRIFCFLSFLIGFLGDPTKALEVHSLTTPKGIKLWYAPDKTVPVISMRFSFYGAGSAYEPEGLEGLTSLGAPLLLEGAGPRDARSLKERLETLGIVIAFDGDTDYFRGTLKTTTRHQKEALTLLKDVLYRPHLLPERLEIIRQQAITVLQNALHSPSYLVARQAREALYPGHPYARPSEGTLESLKRISDSEIKTFLKSKLGRSNLQVSICGALTKEEAIHLVDDLFGELPKTLTIQEVKAPETSYKGDVQTNIQDFPQATCLFYHPGLPYQDKNYMMLQLATHIFGGDFSSRLLREIREKKGLAYDVSAFIANSAKASHMAGSLGSDNARVLEALQDIRKEFAKLGTFGVTEKELKEAQQALIGTFILKLSSTMAIASQLLFYQEIGYPVSYINDRAALILGIKLSDLNTFLKTFLDPQKLTFFVVGTPKTELKDVPHEPS